MNDLREQTERLLAEPWLDRDLAVIEAAAAKVRNRHRRALAAGVVALVVVVGTGVLLAARPESGTGPSGLDVAGMPSRYEHADVDRMVFLAHTATVDEQQAVRQQLLEDPSVGQAWWRTQADSYDEFRCLFADDPAMLESVSPAILPTSFDVALVDGADAAAFEARMRTHPAVMEVVAEASPEAVAAAGTSVPWRPTQPSPCDGTPRAGEPVK